MVYQIIWVLVLLVIGYFIGTYLERKHYRSILKREDALRFLPVVASKYLPENGGSVLSSNVSNG